MKKHFENIALRYVVFGFLALKIISTVSLVTLFGPLGPFALHCIWPLLSLFALLSLGGQGVFLFLFSACVLFLLLILSAILLLINRRGAGFGSILSMVFCSLDILFTAPFYWGITTLGILACFLVSLIFNITIIIMLIVLRRSRPGCPTIIHNIDPTKI